MMIVNPERDIRVNELCYKYPFTQKQVFSVCDESNWDWDIIDKALSHGYEAGANINMVIIEAMRLRDASINDMAKYCFFSFGGLDCRLSVTKHMEMYKKICKISKETDRPVRDVLIKDFSFLKFS